MSNKNTETTELRVHKYPFRYKSPRFELLIEKGARLLRAEHNEDNGEGCVWALVNPKNEKVPRSFLLRGTGQPIKLDEKEQLTYIGTLSGLEGSIYMHLFEVVSYHHDVLLEQ
jgi:hypothetical protein